MPPCGTTLPMHEVGMAIELRAWHVMPGAEGPEGVRHAHGYRIEVRLEREALDERGMVCDLDVLDAAVAEIADIVRDADLGDVIRPLDDGAVTVEVFAHWFHAALCGMARTAGVDRLAVRVWESPDAFGGYIAPVS
jgi:6-pyruvoyltetrahydropterin/6-carboxytetrahydropterin synthase